MLVNIEEDESFGKVRKYNSLLGFNKGIYYLLSVSLCTRFQRIAYSIKRHFEDSFKHTGSSSESYSYYLFSLPVYKCVYCDRVS